MQTRIPKNQKEYIHGYTSKIHRVFQKQGA